MLAGGHNAPWLLYGLAPIVKTKSAAVNESIMEAICLEELGQAGGFSTLGRSRDTANPKDYGGQLKEAVYEN